MDASTGDNLGAQSSVDALWTAVVEPVLTAASPNTLAHVGARSGQATAGLLGYCARHRARAHLIDPDRELDLTTLERRYRDVVVPHPGNALAELEGVIPIDLAILEGDRGGQLVDRALGLFEQRANGDFPIVLVSAARSNGSVGGVAPLVSDFLHTTGLDLEIANVPDRHGLGLIVPHGRLDDRLGELLARFRSSAFLLRTRDRLDAEGVAEAPPPAVDRTEASPQAGPAVLLPRPSGPPDVERDEGVESELRRELESLRAKLTAERSENRRMKGKLKAAGRRQEELSEELRRSEDGVRRWRQEVAATASRVEAVERELELRHSELEAARRRLARQEEELQVQTDKATAERHQAMAERERLQADLEVAQAEVDAERQRSEVELASLREEADRTADRLQAELESLRKEAEQSEQRLRSELAAAKADSKEQRQHRERATHDLRRIASELDDVVEEIERVAASRSWRFGHGTMRFLKRVTFRPPRGRQDALEKTVRHISHTRSRAARYRDR